MGIKEIDLKIMSLLRRNARESLTHLSRQTNIPISTIFDRLKAQSGTAIKKHTVLLNFPLIGYQIRLHMLVRTKDLASATSFLRSHSHVNSVFQLSGEYDFAIDAIFKDMQEVDAFMQAFGTAACLEKINTNYIVSEVVREQFLENTY